MNVVQLNGKHEDRINKLDVLAAIRAKLAGSENVENTVMGMLEECAELNFVNGYQTGLAKGIYKGYTKRMDDEKIGQTNIPPNPEAG